MEFRELDFICGQGKYQIYHNGANYLVVGPKLHEIYLDSFDDAIKLVIKLNNGVN